jgi:3-oxoacyl-[acyl-carrier protein] reductase
MKVAIVTGAGGGIGRAISLLLARKQYAIVVNDVDAAAGKETARLIGKNAYFVQADVSDPEDAKSIVKESLRVFGTPYVLVNNAGVMSPTRFDDITIHQWDRTLAVNLRGPFLLCQAALPYFKEKKAGRIVNISSLAGISGGLAVGADYAVSKAGLITLTKVLARELAPYNVTVNCVAPGTTNSPLIERFSEEQRENLLKLIPLGRFAEPEEIAAVVSFLASKEAGYITGATININGGLLMV